MITSFFKPKRTRAAVADEENGANAKGKADVQTKKQKTTTNNNNADDNEKTKIKTTKDDASSPDTTTEVLISHLSDPSNSNGDDDDDVAPTWTSALDKHFSSPSFKRLAAFVDTERKKHTIYPPPEDTFAALNLCPLSETKLVIVGQDPYHGPNQGHGICFSVRRGIQTPPSLRNIYKELVNDPEVPNFASVPGHGNLERWAKQGVLMINNVLTVRKGQAHSHKKQGWEELTDAILRAVDKRKSFTSNGDDISNSKKPRGVVFLLWGLPATKKTKTALAASSAWSRHTILCSSHPSPLGATKTKAPFMGSRCFSKANEALVEMGYDPIDWRVDGPLP